ncbi:spore germination protein KA [Paenibacillus phyllosphaerae]|uniref:Spore germination protein KA n=1 Tax=Paenibacillus phyllosphaerae TaxID=274593 RepID=A0A7W5AZP9_9BACL|nr:spore germination protein [Paenibacillus phyllosphaerae]MBB3111740.1 spore germination protein KA [Paenibacillus phyllosphaerae]
MTIRRTSRYFDRHVKQQRPSHHKQDEQSRAEIPHDTELTDRLDENVGTIGNIYSSCSDVIYRHFVIAGSIRAVMIYIEGITDTNGIEQFVIAPLLKAEQSEDFRPDQLLQQTLSVAEGKAVSRFSQCIDYLSRGYAILLLEHEASGLALGMAKWEKRALEEPAAEVGIRGPREGFTETLRVNTSMLRRIIKSPRLKLETLQLGEYTQTSIVLAYIEGIAEASLVEEVRSRLCRIEIDGILESGYIEELIEDSPYSPFPQLLNTERPDVTSACLLEGRVAILVEGTPFVLVAPVTMFTMLQAAEDYYQRFWISTITRWLRYFFSIASLTLPAVYVAVLTFHQEMIPGSLLISMAASREAVPFPAFIEALMMEVSFEALREAGVRLPKQVGAAISIVGALVIGQAAVQAGLVSAPMVIVVAITGISSFMIPRYFAGTALRMLRFPLIILASTLGLLGLILGIIAIVVHMCTLRSFGVPYLSSSSTPIWSEFKDTIFRAPWWMMDTRPSLTGTTNYTRQSPNQRPEQDRGEQ